VKSFSLTQEQIARVIGAAAADAFFCLNAAPGLMRLEVQKSLFQLALDHLGETEPVNEVIEITLTADGKVLFETYVLPPG